MKNHDILFDITNKRLGIVRANCSNGFNNSNYYYKNFEPKNLKQYENNSKDFKWQKDTIYIEEHSTINNESRTELKIA